MKSLKAAHSELASPVVQLQCLDRSAERQPAFQERLAKCGQFPLRATEIEVLQVNVGKMCNQTCRHCHVDAGPDRDEIMARETMDFCLEALDQSPIRTVDITGGAPEMNPHFRWFVEEIHRRKREVTVRSNLTILTKTHYQDYSGFFAKHRVRVIASLPCYTATNTDQQRGSGVFDASIQALRALNSLGYGVNGTGLEIDLVYNPLGPSLPPPQAQLAQDYRTILKEQFGIAFNQLYCITNMPISRFLDFLLRSDRYEAYMEILVNAFNPAAVTGVMCRNTLSVGWDGRLYDCDFNQMLELELEPGAARHIGEFHYDRLSDRAIVLGQHCYGCTAGAGSSCRGEIVDQ